MVIDTSAILAILQGEPQRRAFLEAIEGADTRRMSVATFVEDSTIQVWSSSFVPVFPSTGVPSHGLEFAPVPPDCMTR